MNPFFSAIVHATLHKRVTCSHCGSFDHYKRIGHNRFLCTSCRKEFTPDASM